MGVLERAYPRIERAVRLCGAAGWATVQALGLGLLDAEELVRLTVRRFESSSYLDPAYNATSGLWLLCDLTHDLRRGLHYCGASRLR